MAEKELKKEKPRVRIMIPYIEGEDPEQTVGVNGKWYKIIKGEEVEVPSCVASVLSNSNKAMKTALENRKKFKRQVTEL